MAALDSFLASTVRQGGSFMPFHPGTLVCRYDAFRPAYLCFSIRNLMHRHVLALCIVMCLHCIV